VSTRTHFMSIVCTGRNWQRDRMRFTDDPGKVTCLRCAQFVRNYQRNVRIFRTVTK
jgi:hypothetical protein